MRNEDRNLAQFLPRHLLVVKDRVGLHFHQLFHALGGEHAEQHHPPVAHRQPGAAPDGAEEVIDRECEVLAGHVRHLPAVDLVHLLEALLAQFVHDYSFACGTPRPAARFFSATPARGRSTSTASPSASARLRSFSPSIRACRNGSYRKLSSGMVFMSSRNMMDPAPPVIASVWRTTLPRSCRFSPLASASLDASHAAANEM